MRLLGQQRKQENYDSIDFWMRPFHAQFTYEDIASYVGNGSQVTAPDTVPYAIWCAYQGLLSKDFTKTIQCAAKVGGDTDTYCAMIGGIIANVAPPSEEWIKQTERVPRWTV